MSKILNATCQGKIVKVDGTAVPDAAILSEGEGSSVGVLVLDDGRKVYITSSALDLKETLQKVSDALSQVATALTSLDSKPVGGTGSAPVPTVGGNVTAINQAKAALDTLRGALR